MSFTSLLNEVKEILEEELSRFEVMMDRYAKPKKKKNGKVIPAKIPKDILIKLIVADPTTRSQGEEGEDILIQKVGKYVQWIIKQWLGLQQVTQLEHDYSPKENSPFQQKLSLLQNLFLEDLYKTTEDLIKFDRFKSQIDASKRDINKISSTEELYGLTKDFSLEKATSTKAEQKEKRKRDDVAYIYDGNRWEVVVPQTKEVSCDMAGPPLTRWCTASNNYNYYERYSGQGPLYIIRDKSNIVSGGGKGEGEPKPKYQFHFPSSQFMDEDDRSVNLEQLLADGGELNELKEFFKHEFAKSLNKDFGDQVQINYPNDAVSRFIGLYGFDEFFDKLPKSLKRFDFEKGQRNYGGQDDVIPPSPLHPKILNFPDLNVLHIEGLLSELPEEIGRLKNLSFISIPNNPELTSLPESLVDLPNLQVLNIRNNPKLEIGPRLQEVIDNGDITVVR
jgi:Leucine-rich repeat (LRR) protein